MSDVYDDGFGFGEWDSEQLDEGSMYKGNFPTKEGYFHVQIDQNISVSDPDAGKLRYVELTMEILAGCDLEGNDASDQIGHKLKHKVYVEGWTDRKRELVKVWEDAGKQEKLADFLASCPKKEQLKTVPSEKAVGGIKTMHYACGVISAEELGQAKFRPRFEAMATRQMIVKLTRDDGFTKDDGTKIPGRIQLAWNNDCYPIGHERVKDVPIDATTALAGGYDVSAHNSDQSASQLVKSAASSI